MVIIEVLGLRNFIVSGINPLTDEQLFFAVAFWCTKSNKFTILIHFILFMMKNDQSASS